jgi:hypothetical protein
MPLMSITAPQKHLDRPLASWVGSLDPEPHIAYFQCCAGAVLPIFVEVGLCAISEKDPPGFLEVAAPPVEAGRGAGIPVAGLRAWIETAAPLPSSRAKVSGGLMRGQGAQCTRGSRWSASPGVRALLNRHRRARPGPCCRKTTKFTFIHFAWNESLTAAC